MERKGDQHEVDSSSTLQNAIHALSMKKYLSNEDVDTLDWISRDHTEEFFQNNDWVSTVLTMMTAFLNSPVSGNAEAKLEKKNSKEMADTVSSYKRSVLQSLGRLATSCLGRQPVQEAFEQLNECFDAELSAEEMEQGLLPLNAISFLVLLRLESSNVKIIQAQDLLNFADWDIRRGLGILLATLQLPDVSQGDVSRLARIFHGMTTPGAWVAFDGEGYNCAKFSESIDGLMRECLDLKVIEGFASFLAGRLAEQPESSKLFGAVGWTLQAVYNLFLFSKFSTALRGSLSINSSLTVGLIIPYMNRCLDLLEEVGASPPAERALSLGLKLIVSIGFRQKVLPCLRTQRNDLRSEVCKTVKHFFSCTGAWREQGKGRRPMLLVLMLVANLNLLEIDDGEWEAVQKEIFILLRRVCDSMSPNERQQVLVGLEQPKELPLSRDSVSYRTVWAMYARYSLAGSAMLRKWAQEYVSGIFETFNLSRSSFNANYAKWESTQVKNISSDEKGIAPEKDTDVKDSSLYTKDQSNTDDKLSRKEEPAESKFRLLGDLPCFTSGSKDGSGLVLPSFAIEKPPSFEKRRGDSKIEEAKTSHILLQTPDQIPEEFLCCINRHVMKEPVISPQGLCFEKETIEIWLKQQGSICPITQEELTLEDLQLSFELQNKILNWKIQTNIKQTSNLLSTSDLEGEDLYDF